ncbi:MAG TPA: hypothetical protein PLJ35_09605 [Anaerolineae bacterium]|nr:hypothetical protein [Anaerolineae bacterium]HPL28338.1 hypothetical protein [Anaerolineae bacterium]
MEYLQEITAAHSDPRRLEGLYQAARRARRLAEFTAGVQACYAQAPDNVLYAAWHCRLQPAVEEARGALLSGAWRVAIPLSLATGLIFALLVGTQWDVALEMLFLTLAWAPIAGLAIITFLALAGAQERRQVALAASGLLVLGGYGVAWAIPPVRESYRTLMMLHLPLLAWIAVGLSAVGLRSDRENLFAVMAKSLEVIITGGIYVLAGGLFAAITFGMFAALAVEFPEWLMRLLLAGGGGLIPVLAVATVYDPRLRPIEQRFEEGLGKLLPTLTRLLLPLALLILAAYVVAMLANFFQPFRDRDLLIVYNVMLFTVMGLLVGAAPVHGQDLAPRHRALLRAGLLALAALAIAASLHALAAVVYRTILGGLTPNRLTVIGWNGINIALLGLLVWRDLRQGQGAWPGSLQSVAALGAIAYTVWTVFLIVALPWLF